MKEEYQTQIAYLLNQIECSQNEVQIVCNDGRVDINTRTFDFTYIGKFGSAVLSAIIKQSGMNDLTKKLLILSVFMSQYSTHNGGFNVYTN